MKQTKVGLEKQEGDWTFKSSIFIEKGSPQRLCLGVTALFLFQYSSLQIQRLLISKEVLLTHLSIYKVYST